MKLKKLFCMSAACFMLCGLYTDIYAEEGDVELPEIFDDEPSGQTQTDFTYIKLNGRAVITGIRGTKTSITIPAKIDGMPVSGIGEKAFMRNDSLNEIIISEGITEIGSEAFSMCPKLSHVVIPASIEEMDHSVFRGSSSLTSAGVIGSGADIEFGWTDQIPDCAFSNCESLVSVSFPQTLETIGSEAFSSCTSLQEISLPSNITEIGEYAFRSCVNLASVSVGAEEITLESGAFLSCEKLEEINADSVILCGTEVFMDCGSLTKIGVIYGSAIPSSSFSHCDNLAEIYIDDSVAEIENDAFTCDPKSLTVHYYGVKEDWQELLDVMDGDSGNDPLFTAEVIIHDDRTITFDSDVIVLEKEKKRVLTYSVSPESDHTDVKWISSDSKTAVAANDGTVTAKNPGVCQITALLSNGSKAVCRLIIPGWIMLNNRWKYLNSDGTYTSGKWLKISGKWYFFGKDGYMMTGWLKDQEKWYYLNSSGAMAEGWKLVSGTWYYLKPGSGVMAVGWQDVSGKWYYLKGSGAMAKGWEKVNGKWYFLNRSSGAMVTGWLKDNGSWYYLNSSGAMVTGTYRIGGKTYRFNSSGKWIG